MKSKKQIVRVLGIAALTMVFTVTLFGPLGVIAVDKPKEITPVISKPVLKSQGCEFALKTDKAKYQADEVLKLKLEAFNPTNKPVTASVWVNMSSTGPALAMSRKMVLPTSLWYEECPLALMPGEKKTIALKPGVKLPAGQRIMLTMTDKKQVVLANQIGVRASKGNAAPNSQVVNNAQPKIQSTQIQE